MQFEHMGSIGPHNNILPFDLMSYVWFNSNKRKKNEALVIYINIALKKIK